jgi:hypothetical protein
MVAAVGGYSDSALQIGYGDGQWSLNGEPSTPDEIQDVVGPYFFTNCFEQMTQEGAPDSAQALCLAQGHALPDCGPGLASGELTGRLAACGRDGGAAAYEEMMVLVDMGITDMQSARQIRQAHQESKSVAREKSIAATKKEIKAQRDEAAAALTRAWVVAGVSVVLAFAGGFASSALAGAGAAADGAAKWALKGAELAAMNMGTFANVVDKGMVLASHESGPVAEANKQRIEAKKQEAQEAIIDAQIEDAKGNYEGAKELFKLALRVILEMEELKTQTAQKLSNG